jgi:hypothetical protein
MLNQSFELLEELAMGRSKHKKTQLLRFRNYLGMHSASCSMVSNALRIPQKNCTRYKRILEKGHQLWQVKKMKCKKTGHMVWYLTTNPDLQPSKNQLTLF